MTWRGFLLAAVALHLGLIGVVCCRDTFTVIRQGGTILPGSFHDASRAGERCAEISLGQSLPKQNPLRHAIGGYLNAAGIESGYGFFAPHVPAANKLVFELQYGDGRVEYELPSVHGEAAALRLASLLDLIARLDNETVREGLIKYVAYAVWREHVDVVTIRALFGTINFPPPAEFAHGADESYRASHVYDFTFETTPKGKE